VLYLPELAAKELPATELRGLVVSFERKPRPGQPAALQATKLERHPLPDSAAWFDVRPVLERVWKVRKATVEDYLATTAPPPPAPPVTPTNPAPIRYCPPESDSDTPNVLPFTPRTPPPNEPPPAAERKQGGAS
jgi:hypothetical protein